MSLFCPPQILDSCNLRATLQTVLLNMCAAECRWDNIRYSETAPCDADNLDVLTETFDDLWDCASPPEYRLVVRRCNGNRNRLYYWDESENRYEEVVTNNEVRFSNFGPFLPSTDFELLFDDEQQPPNTGALVYYQDDSVNNPGVIDQLYGFSGSPDVWYRLSYNKEVRVQNILTPTIPTTPTTAFNSVQASTGAIFIASPTGQVCTAPLMYYWDSTVPGWEQVADITSRYIGFTGNSGQVCTTSTTGVNLTANIGLTNPFNITLPNFVCSWTLMMGLSGYHSQNLCNGFIDVYIDGVATVRSYHFASNSALQNYDNTVAVGTWTNLPGTVRSVELRIGQDTTFNACVSGTQSCWTSFRADFWLEPRQDSVRTQW